MLHVLCKACSLYVRGRVAIFGLNVQMILRSVGICMVYLRDLFKADIRT